MPSKSERFGASVKSASIDFRDIAGRALTQGRSLVLGWLPGGRFESLEYVVKNPKRADAKAGSFKINVRTGIWSDFATGDSGRDLLDLKAYLDGVPLKEAAERLADELGLAKPETSSGFTLDDYAALKRLPADLLAKLGLETVQNPYRPMLQALAIPYRRPDGSLLRIRYRVSAKGDPKLIWDRSQGRSVSLYGLDCLESSSDPLFLVEGESDCHTLWFRRRSALGVPGASTFKPSRDDVFLEGRRIVALVEPDRGGDAFLKRLTQSKAAPRIAIARLDGFKDASALHFEAPDRFDAVLDAAVAAAIPLTEIEAKPRGKTRTSPQTSIDDEDKQPTQADRMVAFAQQDAVLFKTPSGIAHAQVQTETHREVWPVRSRGFKDWLLYRYFQDTGRAPNTDALNQALATIEALAKFTGETAPVFTRTAFYAGKLYLDLCDEGWRGVEVTETGWRVLNEPPVAFVRAKGMLSLPEPQRGADISELRPLLNINRDDDFRLVVGWLLTALRGGPYPLLALAGEAGSAKSTAAKVLRSLFDPNASALRSAPKDERDLFIAASNAACLVYDNLSSIPGWMSDALCRVATGGGFATRALHTDQDEVLFDVTRPILITSVGEVIARSDLADRAMLISLGPIADTDRVSDAVFETRLNDAVPRILGALLDGVRHGLGHGATPPARLPRMASFVAWVSACEGAYWEEGAVQAAFERNMMDAVDSVLEGDAVAVSLLAFLDKHSGWWKGKGEALLEGLSGFAPDGVKRDRGWPRNPQHLSSRLTLAAPSLRKKGILIEKTRTMDGRWISITDISRPTGGTV